MAKTIEQTVNVNEVSRISQGACIKGDLSANSDIRVDGRVEGTLYSNGRIVVGETAKLSGSMLCENVDFWGQMDGDIYVKDVLSIKSSAVINGNIHVRRLQVEIGAQINGSCMMITEEDYEKYVSTVVKNIL